jgi:hypothetical protein
MARVSAVIEATPVYHASLDAAEYKELLTRQNFELIDHRVEDPRAGGRTV